MKESLPLVSIGLPVYNGMPYVKRAIESLLLQTYPHVEIVITDNPSTDDTQKICEEYARKDKRVRYIRHPKNIGAYENYNSALQAARGKYFGWISYDDFVAPEYVEKCAALLEKDEEAVMAMTDYVHTDASGKPTHKLDPAGFVPLERGLYARLKRFILMRWWDGKAMTIHGIWRREEIVHDAYHDLPDGDVNFSFRGLARGPFLLVPEVLFYKCVLPGGESREGEPMTFMRALAAIWNRIKLTRTYFLGMKYILGFPGLSFTERLKLLFFECFATCRMFLRRRY